MLNGSVTPHPHPASRKAYGCVRMHLDAQTTHTHIHTQTSLALSHAPKKGTKKSSPVLIARNLSSDSPCSPPAHSDSWLAETTAGILQAPLPPKPQPPLLLYHWEKDWWEKRKKGKTDTWKSKRHYVAFRLTLPSLLMLFTPVCPTPVGLCCLVVTLHDFSCTSAERRNQARGKNRSYGLLNPHH